MTAPDYLYCPTCGTETLHAVVRNGQGEVSSSACKDEEHATRAAESAILVALRSGSIDAGGIPRHAELSRHPRQAITRAVSSLEAAGQIIVLRETGDTENPFPFSGLMPAEG